MRYQLRRRTRQWGWKRWRLPAALAGVFVLGIATGGVLVLQMGKVYGLGVLKKVPGLVKKDASAVQAAHTISKSTTAADSTQGDSATSNKSSVSGTSGGASVSQDGLRIAECKVSGAVHSGLSGSSVPQLRKLAEYEQVCASPIISRASFFVGTPKDAAAASSDAAWVASVLKEFSRQGIAPLVFMEPVTANGVVNFTDYRNGAYDSALDAYFAALKSNGVTDSTMGIWVPFPEGNIPVWGNVDPNDFTANFTKTVQFQKKYFPGSKAAVLLESKTYPSGSSWENGRYVSLLPYVQNIPRGLADSFGLQGFAWPPTAPGDTAQLDPTQFLRIDFAAEAARSLGVSDIWMNTGVFNKSYVVSRTSPYTLTPLQRQQVLDGILSQAKKLQGQGFRPTVHLFAENKGATDEAIDWSFWPAGQMDSSPSTPVFKTFAHDLNANGVGLWLYDAAQ